MRNFGLAIFWFAFACTFLGIAADAIAYASGTSTLSSAARQDPVLLWGALAVVALIPLGLALHLLSR